MKRVWMSGVGVGGGGVWGGGREVGVPPYNSLYEEVSLKRGSYFKFQVYERARISLVEVYESVGK